MSSLIKKIRAQRFARKGEDRVQINNNIETKEDAVLPFPAQTGVSDLGEPTPTVDSEKSVSLAYTLDLLLKDTSALPFFIHFLESCGKINLIKFWMHVEGFRASFAVDEDSLKKAAPLAVIDATTIYDRYIIDGAVSSISVPRKIKEKTEINLSMRPLKCDCFDECQLFVRRLFELRYFEEFQSSVYYKKHELDVLRSSCSLNSVLHIQTLLQSFMEFVENVEDMARIQLLLAIDSFENEYLMFSDEELLADAMAIYERYFSMQSNYRLNINDVMRMSIESAICSENGKPNVCAFRPAANEIYTYLNRKYLSNFVSSSSFKRYTDDLVAQIDSTIELPCSSGALRPRGGSTESSCDSLPSVFQRHCQQLSRGEVAPTLQKRRSFSDSTKSDRQKNLAEIDNMGRYRPLYDDSLSQDSAANSSSKLKLKLRKYLDKNTLKEEEIAEEVAKTIISDIQSMVQLGQKA